MKPGVYQFLVGCFAALGSFLFGYDLGVIAEVVASGSFKSLFLQQNANSRSGTVVALFTGGCFTGALGAGFSDRLGRRGTILMACCIFVVGGTIQTAGVTIGMLYAGRFIAGIGVGFLTVSDPPSGFVRGTDILGKDDHPHLSIRDITSSHQRQDHKSSTVIQCSGADLRYVGWLRLLCDLGC
jgi:MFS family permease